MSVLTHAGLFPGWRLLSTAFFLCFLSLIPVTPAFALWDEMLAEQMEAAEAGDADAQYEVGIKYLKGQGVERDLSRAMHWLKQSAKAGNTRAITRLQRMQEQQERFQAILQKARTGDAAAQYTVGMMYLKGKGVAPDGGKAREWIGKAARQKDPRAITRLGILYLKGEGGSPNYPRALELFRSVSDSSVLAQYYLGEMYAAGKGVKQDYHAAIDWYRKAVDGGFKRAGGKIINMEEELRMASRRQHNATATSAAKPVDAAPAPVAPQVTATAEKPAPVAKKKPAAKVQQARKKVQKKPVASKPRLTALEKLARVQWVRRDKPVDYLPSSVTLCEMDGAELVCFSKVLKRSQGSREVEYRVKSEIREQRDGFVITYRNLVLDVVETGTGDDEDQPLGYDDEVDQGFTIRTGWTQNHQVECSRPKGGELDCMKDRTHKMRLVGR